MIASMRKYYSVLLINEFLWTLFFLVIIVKFDYTRTPLGLLSIVLWDVIVLLFSILIVSALLKFPFNSLRSGITSVAILVFFDQAIKAALYFPFDELSITLIPGILNIYVILNHYQTLVLQMAGVYVSSYLVAFFKMLLLPLFFLLLFIFSRSKSKFNFRTEIGYIGIILVSSAIISTVIDSLIYKGTPDYFYLIQLYSSADLKDIFAFLGAGCLLSIVSTKGAFKG